MKSQSTYVNVDASTLLLWRRAHHHHHCRGIIVDVSGNEYDCVNIGILRLYGRDVCLLLDGFRHSTVCDLSVVVKVDDADDR